MWGKSRCATCGKKHTGFVMVFGPDSPLTWAQATDDERAEGELSADLCAISIDGEMHYYVRGHIEILVTDGDGTPFSWTVWVSLSASNWAVMIDHWQDPKRDQLEPMFGWLNSALPPYEPSTISLATNVHQRAVGVVPLIELDPSLDHPLVREQLHGITLHRVAEINAQLLGE